MEIVEGLSVAGVRITALQPGVSLHTPNPKVMA